MPQYTVRAHSYTNKKGKTVTVKAHTRTSRGRAATTYTTRAGLGRRTVAPAVKKRARRAPVARVSVPIRMPSIERYAGSKGNIKRATQKHYASNKLKQKVRSKTRPTIPVSVRLRKTRKKRR